MVPACLFADLEFAWPGQSACLKIASAAVNPKKQVFLHGPSGCGKSTLLALLGGILLPQSGRLEVFGTNPAKLSGRQRDRFRVDHIGFIFQQFNLIPYLDALGNVLLPCRFSPQRAARAAARDGSVEASARALLATMGLHGELLGRPANRLSVGQQQRVAAARALIGQPPLVIADEPTSALDADRQQGFLDLLQTECRAAGSTLIFVSHDQRLATRFEERISLPGINQASAAEEAA